MLSVGSVFFFLDLGFWLLLIKDGRVFVLLKDLGVFVGIVLRGWLVE